MAELTQAERFAQAAQALEGKPRRPWGRYAVRAAVGLVVAYVLLVVGLWLFQKSMIFRPTVETALTAVDNGFAPQQAQDLQTTTSDGITLRGWHVSAIGGQRADLSKARLVVLFFTGNRGNRSYRDVKFRRLSALGAEVICFDYRGYGDSGGSPSEEGLALDARAAWDYLQKKNVKPESIVIHGESMGGAVAIRLASELSAQKTPPAGLVVEGTFPRMLEVAQRLYPFIPVSLILNQNFPSIDRIGSVECPLLMLHGTCDTLVPIGLGRQLFDAAPEAAREVPKQFIELSDCAHADIGIQDAKAYDNALRTFFNTVCPLKNANHLEHHPPGTPRHQKVRPAMNQPEKTLEPKSK